MIRIYNPTHRPMLDLIANLASSWSDILVCSVAEAVQLPGLPAPIQIVGSNVLRLDLGIKRIALVLTVDTRQDASSSGVRDECVAGWRRIDVPGAVPDIRVTVLPLVS